MKKYLVLIIIMLSINTHALLPGSIKVLPESKAHSIVELTNCNADNFFSIDEKDKTAMVKTCLAEKEKPIDIMSEQCSTATELYYINSLSNKEIEGFQNCKDELLLYKKLQWAFWEEYVEAYDSTTIETESYLTGISAVNYEGSQAASLNLAKFRWDIGGGYYIPFVLITNDEEKSNANAVLAQSINTNAGFLNLKSTGSFKVKGSPGALILDYSHNKSFGLYHGWDIGAKLDHVEDGSGLDSYASLYAGWYSELIMPLFSVEENRNSTKAGKINFGAMALMMYNDDSQVEKYLTKAGLTQDEASDFDQLSGVLSTWVSFNLTNYFNCMVKYTPIGTNSLIEDKIVYSINFESNFP